MLIENINSEDLRAFIINRTKKLELREKALKAMFGYINSTLMYGVANQYITINVASFVKIRMFYKYCYNPIVTTEERTVSKEQMKSLYKKLDDDKNIKPDYLPNYAVKLASYTGMRVGELAALMWECVFDDYILINKSEQCDRVKKEYTIHKTKNGRERKIPITSEIKQVLDEVRDIQKRNGYISQFVFGTKDDRIHAKRISDCSLKKTKQASGESKSVHALRRTVNSNLKTMGVSTVVAASILGHTEEVNNKNYSYDMSDMKERQMLLEQVNQLNIV